MLVAWDTETALIERGRAAPPITCLSYATDKGGSGLLHWTEAKDVWLQWARDPNVVFVGQNVAFDHAVLAAEWPDLLPIIFQLYDDERVFDTMLRQKLIDLADGRLGGFRTDKGVWVKLEYSLEALARRRCQMKLDKDTWRLRYGELRNVPLDQWEPGAREYPIQDALATLRVFEAQQEYRYGETGADRLADQWRQAKHAWWLQLMTVWGIRTSPERVDRLVKKTTESYGDLEVLLKQEGLVRPNGKRNIAAVRDRLIKANGGEDKCRKTDKGQVSTDSEACTSSEDPVLENYAEFTKYKVVLAKDIPMLLQGKRLPIHSRFNTLLATGRTSSSGPNIQNIRRLAGIRECFVPRPGFVFATADYDGLELRTLAQVCYLLFGKSSLGEALNAGRDPHLEIAAYILNIPYSEAKARRKQGDKEVDLKRQMGKVCNFGCPGGLGAETLTFYAKANFNLQLTIPEAANLKENVWKKKWEEMAMYMEYIAREYDKWSDGMPVTQFYSNRIRGKCTYTQACNTLFQGLGADATKAAGYLISKACYVDKSSVLYGSRIVNFVHDEFILEVPVNIGHECALELARLMEEGAAPWLPDVPPKVSEPLLSSYWSKDAKQVWKNGRLIPWQG